MIKIKQTVILVIFFLGCQNTFGQKKVSEAVIQELEAAEIKMFDGITRYDPEYFKDYVADDYFTINADGVTANKAQTLADSARGKFLSAFTYKMFDKKIRVYDNVGIINGRVQAFMKETLAAEFLYTAIFVKQKGKWMYTGWQGTISKDSPRLPTLPQN